VKRRGKDPGNQVRRVLTGASVRLAAHSSSSVRLAARSSERTCG
jgi:hypothetical protein